MLETIELALAVAAMSITVTMSSMFDKLRAKTEKWPTVHKLLSCPYCFSHWLAFGAAWAQGYRWLALVVAAFVIVALSALVAGAINHLLMFYQKRVDLLEQQVETYQKLEAVYVQANDDLTQQLRDIAGKED